MRGISCMPELLPSEITIREIREEDAAEYLELARRLDRETRFMMLEPGERSFGVDQQRQRIRSVLEMDNAVMLIAEHQGRLVGVLGASGGIYRRNRHSVHIFIGVLQAFAGRGLGTRLFEALESWARSRPEIHRLELTVMTHNTRAIGLYQKMGFTIEGTRRHSLLVDGEYVDEYCMAKLISEDLG